MLAEMGPESSVVTVPEFAAIDTEAVVEVIDLGAWEGRLPKAQLALTLLTVAALRNGLISVDALLAAGAGPFAADNENGISAGLALAG